VVFPLFPFFSLLVAIVWPPAELARPVVAGGGVPRVARTPLPSPQPRQAFLFCLVLSWKRARPFPSFALAHVPYLLAPPLPYGVSFLTGRPPRCLEANLVPGGNPLGLILSPSLSFRILRHLTLISVIISFPIPEAKVEPSRVFYPGITTLPTTRIQTRRFPPLCLAPPLPYFFGLGRSLSLAPYSPSVGVSVQTETFIAPKERLAKNRKFCLFPVPTFWWRPFPFPKALQVPPDHGSLIPLFSAGKSP